MNRTFMYIMIFIVAVILFKIGILRDTTCSVKYQFLICDGKIIKLENKNKIAI